MSVVKSLFKSLFIFVFYILLFFTLIVFLSGKLYFHQDWFTITEVIALTATFLVVIFFVQYSSQITQLKFCDFELMKATVEERIDKLFLVKYVEDMIEGVGMKLKNMAPTQIGGDENRQLEKVYTIPEVYRKRLTEEDIDKLRQLWNKYYLMALATHCLAFFDKEGFGLRGDELKRIRSSPIPYFPSPDRVLSLSKKAKFKERMEREGNCRVIEQFNIFFQHFLSSYQEDRKGEWLKWDLPRILSEMQVKS